MKIHQSNKKEKRSSKKQVGPGRYTVCRYGKYSHLIQVLNTHQRYRQRCIESAHTKKDIQIQTDGDFSDKGIYLPDIYTKFDLIRRTEPQHTIYHNYTSYDLNHTSLIEI